MTSAGRDGTTRSPSGVEWALVLALVAVAAALSRVAEARAAGAELITPPAIRFERVDAAHAFPQGSIYSLTERADGYLWATTLDGLVRFDGLRQRTFDRGTSPGLLTSRLTALYDHRPSGDLWIGAEDGGVIRLRGGRLEALDPGDDALGAVTALWVDHEGRRVFVFHHAGARELLVTDDADGGGGPRLTGVGAALAGFGHYGCGALLGERELWRADERGFFAIPLPPGLVGRYWLACRSDPRGGLWLRASGADIYRIEGEAARRDPRSASVPDDAVPLFEAADGDLWLRFRAPPRLGRLDRGGRLIRYDERFGVDPLGDPLAVHVDREGGLWVATTSGLYRHRGEAIAGLSLREGGAEAPVAIHHEAADGVVWIAGRDASLAALRPDGALVRFTEVDHTGRQVLLPEFCVEPDGTPCVGVPPGLAMVSVFREDRAGRIWIGVDVGLLVYAGDGALTVHRAHDRREALAPGELPGGVNDILLDDEGAWLATEWAAVRFEGGRVVGSYGPAEGIERGALALLRDHEGTLWAGTRAGVVRLRGDRFEAVPGLGPELGQARALHEDGEGRLWVGTYDRGLYRRLPGGEVEHAGAAEGLPGGAFTLRFDDRGFLWTTSNRGLSRTRVADLDRVLGGLAGRAASVLYDHAAGLPGSECNGGFGGAAYPCEGDAWCVHTLGGAAVVRLDDVRVSEAPPLPVIEEAQVDGAPRSIDGGVLTLQPAERDLVIRYTGVAFDGAAAVTFRHRLVGHDRRWVAAEGRREALFSDLPPGEYTFEVHAEGREGVESPAPARLAVVALPAWWELPWVQASAVLLAFGLAGAGVRWRLRAIGGRHRREQAALRAAADELEARVRERTAVLNAEVIERRRAEEAARQASAVKSAFVAQMSHELRTPMNAILGLSELLSKSPLTPEQQAWVRTVRSSGDALLSIIEDILDFSRIEAGRLEIERRELAPAEVVREAVEIVAQQAHARGLTLTWSADPEVPGRAVGDPARIRQVLLNLLSNAVKFTLQGSITVHAGATATDEGWRLTIAVRDTGIGIPPEARARIFEPFAQAEASTSRRFGGSGLGLSITQRLLTMMGGGLTLESEAGVGSTFTAQIPVGRPRADPAGEGAAAAPAGPAGDEPAASLPGLRVLVTEDDTINQMVARAILARAGHTCAVASSGAEALAALGREDFDVVLMDLHMPGLSGVETSRRIRAELPAERQPWIVALTAAVTVEDRHACHDAGMNEFLGKPVREAAVRRALAGAIAWRSGRARGAAAGEGAPGAPALTALTALTDQGVP